MEKIYRLRAVANELLSKRGHVFSRYQREFHIDRGALIKVLWNNCNRCGAWVRITDYPPKGEPEFTGPAFDFNCKHGEVPVEEVVHKNLFVGNYKKEYTDEMDSRRKKAIKRFKI